MFISKVSVHYPAEVYTQCICLNKMVKFQLQIEPTMITKRPYRIEDIELTEKK